MIRLARFFGRLTLITVVTAMLVFGGLLVITGLHPEADAQGSLHGHHYYPMCEYDYIIVNGDHVEAKVLKHDYSSP